MCKKLGQEPAFPFLRKEKDAYGEEYNVFALGMSKRLLIAKDAMCAIISARNNYHYGDKPKVAVTPEEIVAVAYAFTDELLKQE